MMPNKTLIVNIYHTFNILNFYYKKFSLTKIDRSCYFNKFRNK